MQETTVSTYRVALSQTEWEKASNARRAAGELWTRLVKIHRFCRRRHWPWPTETQLKAHFKRRLPLHSQTVQALIEKFCATIDGVRTKRRNGDKQARYPWRFRRYFNPIFKGQALKTEGQHLLLPLGRGRDPIRVHLPAARPPGTMVQAELGYSEIYLTVTRELPDPLLVPSGKVGGLDIGVIHLGMVSDGHEALAISGRGLRSVKQGRAKGQAKLQKKRSRTKPGSRRRKRLNRAQHRVSNTVERVTRNALHHAATERCVLAVHVDSMMGPLEELWPLFHPNQEPPHMMVFADLYPLLLEAGIVANVTVIEQGAPRFADPASATSMWARRLAIQDDPQATEQLATWVAQHWDRVTGRRRRSAIMSWRPEPLK